MPSILFVSRLTKIHKALLFGLLLSTGLVLGGGRAHAASLTVSGSCSISDAIDSVNSAADSGSCTSTGTYGTDDTITIPAGTQTLSNDLPTITQPIKVHGAGIAATTIDADGSKVFSAQNTSQATFTDMKITGYRQSAISAFNTTDIALSNIDIDGHGADVTSDLFGIIIEDELSGTHTVNANNIYIHDLNGVGSGYINTFIVDQSNGGTTDATLSNITLSNISNTGVGVNGLMTSVGVFGSNGSGTMNSNINNATVDNVTSNDLTGPFASFAIAGGGTATINTHITNATITGTRGVTAFNPPFVGVKSAAFYSAAVALTGSDHANVAVSVENSLMADNLNDGVSSNCSASDLTSGFGGTGTPTATISSLGHNMSDDASCSQFTQSGDKQNVSNIISTLGPLQNNGGVVPTRALLAGSPAISAGGHVLGISTDARGIARPSTCPSVGAYQYVGAVCGASTVNASAGVGAPNTGIGPASPSSVAATVIYTLVAGLGILGFGVVKIRKYTSKSSKA